MMHLRIMLNTNRTPLPDSTTVKYRGERTHKKTHLQCLWCRSPLPGSREVSRSVWPAVFRTPHQSDLPEHSKMQNYRVLLDASPS